MIYEIPIERKDDLEKKLNHLNNKAKKLGMPQFDWHWVGDIERPDSEKAGFYRTFCQVEVPEDFTVGVSGWSFVARLVHNNGRENPSVRSIQEVPLEYYVAGSNCDHCGVDRFRNDTYVFTKDGQYIQVGSTCLLDYVGANNPSYLAELAEFDIEEFRQFDNSVKPVYTVNMETFLGYTIYHIKKNGYISRSHARENLVASTADTVWYDLLDNPESSLLAKPYAEKAKEMIEWAAGLAGDNSYVLAIKRIALDYLENGNGVSWFDVGFVASVVYSYNRAMEQTQETKESDFIDEVKNMTFRVLQLFYNHTAYGTYQRIIMVNDNGDKAVWNDHKMFNIETGDEITIEKARVAGHDNGKYGKQTKLTHVKLA